MSNERSSRIPSLDGLRALSISLVLFGHLCGTQNFWSGDSLGFLGFGEFGVRVFFVISGLLITKLLLNEFGTTGKIHLAKFYFRRTFRIFPPYYAFLFFLIIVQPLGWFLLNDGDIWHTLTYTSNYHLERSWNVGHTWSLSVEEQFYLLWPAALLLLGVRRGWKAAVLVLLLSPFIRLGIFHLWPSRAEGVGHQFETVADAIATGCVLACQTAWPQWARAWYERLLQSRLMLALPVLGFAGNSLSDHPTPSFLFGYTLANLCIGVCVDWCIRNHEGRLGRVLNSAPLVFVGTISYSLYLWQQLFLNRHSDNVTASFPLNLTLAVGAALLSYYLIEKPSLRLRQRLEARLFPKGKPSQQTERALVLPFEQSTPSVRAVRILRLNAQAVSEPRDEQPTEGFLKALQRLEAHEQRATLSDALTRLSYHVKSRRQ